MGRRSCACLALTLCLLALPACRGSADVQIEDEAPRPLDPASTREDRGLVAFEAIREASGLAASRQNAGVLWTHNDSGDAPRLFALGVDGAHLGVFTLDGAAARDWEDLALGPGPVAGQDYLYVGDIGDNEAQYDLKTVYRVPEPPVAARQAPVEASLTGVEAIRLRYPDGPRDAETLLVDPLTKDLYVVTKRSTTVDVYRAPYPQSTTEVVEMARVTTLDLDPVPDVGPFGQGAVAGDVAPSGLDVLVKTYSHVFLWTRPSAQAPLFSGVRTTLPYVPEPQGEALAWAADGRGYFTVSEERQNIPARLYFYPLQTPR